MQRNLVSGAELPEILNNLAIARARQGDLAPALSGLGRARDIDPDEDDYPFNLGLLALREKDFAAAETHFTDALEREPDNAEDVAFLIYALEKQGKKRRRSRTRETAEEAFGENGVPQLKLDGKNADSLDRYERIKRRIGPDSLRLELECPQIQQNAEADPVASGKAAVAHIRRGNKSFELAAWMPRRKNFARHCPLSPLTPARTGNSAEIYRRRGKLDEATQELQLSLEARDSAAARTILARIYLEQKKNDLARAEAETAIKLAPNYPEAKELLDHLEKTSPREAHDERSWNKART